MKTSKIDKLWLTFNEEVPTVDFNIKVPLIVDEKDNVLMGNCLRENINALDEIDVIIIHSDPFIKQVLKDLELAFVEENSMKRFNQIEKEVQTFLAYIVRPVAENLFEFDREHRTIEEVEFIKPPAYNFHKGKRKGKNNEDLFSGS